jgi:hypothetical protein
MNATDAIFIRGVWNSESAPSATDLDAIDQCARDSVSAFAPLIGLQCAHDLASRRVHIYANLKQTTLLGNDVCITVQRQLAERVSMLSVSQVARLEKVFDAVGKSSSKAPAFHYAVETDVDEGWWPEFARWYDEEHMPGLAAVAGCVHAARYINHDQGPRSHASYLLVTESTKGSPPWMLMTDSSWSSRVRPHFVNTIRTMMRSVRA